MRETIRKYFEGIANEDEQKQLLNWLESKENFIEFKKEKFIWKKECLTSIVSQDIEAGLVRLQSHIMSDEFANVVRLKKIRDIYRYAVAIMLILLLTVGGIFIRNRMVEPLYTSVIADNGHVSKIILPDQSEVWLNSGSSLTYNDKFAKSNRDLKLEGQAYFDIKHDDRLPLVVQSKDINVKVLGTKFEVEAFEAVDKTSILLEKGSVEMSLVKDPSKKVILKPGQRAVFEANSGKIVRDAVNTDKYTSWRKGILNIYNCPLSEAVLKLERRYNYKFIVDERFKEYKISLSIEDEDLDDVLTIMENIAAVKIKQYNDTIYFESRKK